MRHDSPQGKLSNVQSLRAQHSGVARFFGLASFAVDLGILEKLDDDYDDSRDPREIMQLGLTGTRYAITGDTTKVAKYLEVAREVAVKTPKEPRASTPGTPRWPEMAAMRNGAYADSVRAALKSIGQRTDTIPTKSGTGYCSDFLVRKMYLGCIASASDGTPQSWENVSLMRLREFCADAREHMSSLPETWTAAEASTYMCMRPDWAMFISMYMCLWKEVSDAAEKADTFQDTIRWIFKHSEELFSKSVKFKAQHGFSPHPWILMREAGWSPTGGKRKRKDGA